MRYALSGAFAPIVFLCLLLVLGAASPFDRVPLGEAAYDELLVLDQAGLLEEYTLPQGELSRLEAAVLVQRGFSNYGDSLLGGTAADPAVERALTGLLEEFATELNQLGTKAEAMPSGQPPLFEASELEHRIAYLEAELAEYEEDDGYTSLQDVMFCGCEWDTAEDACVADQPEVSLYGDFYIQGQAVNTNRADDTSTEFSDIDLYWGELGVEAAHGDWSGRFSILLGDDDDDVLLNEAWARYDHPCSGWFFQAGQVILPFGNNAFYFPTYPAVNDLGFTTARAAGFGLERECWGAGAWAFNPDVELVDEENTISDYAFVWNVTRRAADECHNGWALTAGYTSHLAAHDIRLAGGDPLIERVGGYNVYGRYDWGGNRYHLLADYTAADGEFHALDLDANDDGVGDAPSAFNAEFVYEPCPDNLWGVSYQMTDEMADYADTRYGLLYGKRLSDLVMLKLEYTHGEYEEYVTAGQDSDDTFVAELNFAF